MKKLIFFDMTAPYAYDDKTLKTTGCGGTEATLIRIAEGLADTFDVTVCQKERVKDYKSKAGVKYVTLDKIETIKNPHAVINLRSAMALPFLREMFKDTKLLLWLHDLEGTMGISSPLADALPILEETKALIVTVSSFHNTHIKEVLTARKKYPDIKMSYIYNPIDDKIVPNKTKYDKNKLLFLSSPHKGLDMVMSKFKNLKNNFPDLKLHIANPGYLQGTVTESEDIKVLGELKHSDVIKELRSAFCLFFPNPDYFTRETFGIVFAEANAVGTPVLTHAHGGAIEILSDSPQQLIDVRDDKMMFNTFDYWYNKERPTVKLNKNFRLSSVLKDWKEILR